MKREIVFHSVTVEGFRSYQSSTSFPLDSKGINLIKGENGAGKTTLFSALSWCLYKVNLNDTVNDKVQTWEWQRGEEYRGTRVVVDFTVGKHDYRIARHLKFKGKTAGLKAGDSLMIFKKLTTNTEKFSQSDLVGEAHHKGDQQEYINRLLGFDSKTFLNSVLFGQRMDRLVKADNKEKRELFEKLFAVDFIDLAKEKAKDKKILLEAKLTKITTDISSTEQSVEDLTTREEEQQSIIDSFKADKTKRVAAAQKEYDKAVELLEIAEEELEELQDKLPKTTKGKSLAEIAYDTYEQSRTAVEQAKTSLRYANKRLNENSDQIANAQTQESKLKKDLLSIKTKCVTCSKPIDKGELDKIKANIQKQIDTEVTVQTTLKKSAKEYTDEVNKADKVLGTAEKVMEQDKAEWERHKENEKNANQIQTDYKLKEQEVKNLKKDKMDAATSLATEKAAKAPEVDIKGVRDKINKHNADLAKWGKEQEEIKVTLERVLWWYNKAFSAGGLKAFVFSAMLSQLNVSVQKYAARLGFGVRFSIDLSKDSKPFVTKCYKGDHEIDYAELSGGQKQRVDVCLAFALHDVVSAISNFNILIMDEIFEGLDAGGIETVFDLVRIKAGEGRTVFVVTHLTIDSLNAKTINVSMDELERSYIK